MPIVSGNEPEQQQGGRNVLWLVPLLFIASGPVANIVRQLTGWPVTQMQVLLAGGLLIAAAWLLWPNATASRRKPPPGAPMAPPLPAKLPTPMTPQRATPPPSTVSGSMLQSGTLNRIPAPQFEPYITGKVMLAGCLLFVVFGAAAVTVILLASSS